MVIFSIIHRELMGAARKRGTFLGRSVSAAIALVLFCIVLSTHQGTLWRLGPDLLNVVSFVAFVEALIAGARFTSDCISEEKREGTIGLLFLTRMSPLEVVLGKLATRSLGAIYNLIAILPVFWLCILVGGVSWRQIIAVTLVLFSATFFSLSCGIFVSCRGMQEKLVLIGSLVLPAAVCVIPLALSPILNLMFEDHSVAQVALLLSPIYAYNEAVHDLQPSVIQSCAWMVALSFALVVLGASRLKKTSLSVADEKGERVARGEKSDLRPRRRLVRFPSLLRSNPAEWLARQRQNEKSHFAFCMIALAFGIVARVLLGMKAGYGPPIAVFGGYLLHAAYKFMVTAEAVRKLNHDRRSGALELLLCTPLPPRVIIAGIFKSTRYLVRPGAICLAISNMIWMTDRDFLEMLGTLLPASMLLIFTDAFALAWRGMAIGLRGQPYARTVMRAYLQVMLTPTVLWLLFYAFVIGSSSLRSEDLMVMIVLWTGMSILFDLYWLRRSRAELHHFRKIASGDNEFGRLGGRQNPPKTIRSLQPVPMAQGGI